MLSRLTVKSQPTPTTESGRGWLYWFGECADHNAPANEEAGEGA
jgi:hypothetical protein